MYRELLLASSCAHVRLKYLDIVLISSKATQLLSGSPLIYLFIVALEIRYQCLLSLTDEKHWSSMERNSRGDLYEHVRRKLEISSFCFRDIYLKMAEVSRI